MHAPPHLESLAARLNEPRVRRVIEPLIARELPVVNEVYDDDVAYVRGLGLIALDKSARIANPIYREVIVRALGAPAGPSTRLRTNGLQFAGPLTGLAPTGWADLLPGPHRADFARCDVRRGDA